MTLCNMDIRNAAKASNIPLWSIAKSLKISENTFYRMLREELEPGKKKEILRIIKELEA